MHPLTRRDFLKDEKVAHFQQNVAAARRFKAMTAEEMQGVKRGIDAGEEKWEYGR